MPVRWRKVWVSDESYEAAGVFDVNNDGVPDIVSGAWWYEGPDYKKKHHICNVAASGEYYDDFSVLPMDVNGDGHMDFVTGGWWGDTIRWRENPGDSNKEWKEHIIANVGNVETTRLWDVDGDGQLEIVPNTPNRELAVYKLKTDSKGRGTGEFTKHLIREEAQGHGLGCGDIAGNGRSDFVISKGWLEAPKNTFKDEWKWHPDFDLGCGSIPIIVTDVNKDGVNDIIVGQAHPFGLDWWEQRIAKDGKRTWIRHPIDPFNAQYHDMHWVDIDGDG